MTAYNVIVVWLVGMAILLGVIIFTQVCWIGFVYLFNMIDRYIQK